MSVGCDQKNLSITPARAPSSQPATTTTPSSSRRPTTLKLRRRMSERLLVARSTARVLIRKLSRAALLTLIAHQDLVAKVLPDLLIDFDEARLESDLGHVARARKV